MTVLFDSTAFLAAMRQGGAAAERAARQLLQHYRPRLRARLVAAGVSTQQLDDLLAELLFKIITQCHQVRAAEALHSWIMTLARHELAAHWRQLGRERELFSEAEARGGDASDEGDAMRQLLQDLPDAGASDPLLRLCLQGQLARFEREHPRRHACISLVVMGHEPREIGELLGRSYGAARQFISECCAAVLAYLRPCLDEGRLPMRRGAAGAEQ